MGTMSCENPAKYDLWPEYRNAFAEFSQNLLRAQTLANQPDPDPEVLLRASIEVEDARMRYNCRRDALVQQFLPGAPGRHMPACLGIESELGGLEQAEMIATGSA